MTGLVHRNFDDDMPTLRTEGPTFTLGGEEFHCVPEASGGVLARLVASIGFDDRGRQTYHLPNMNQFVEDVLLEEREVEAEQPPAVEGETPAAPVIVTEKCDDVERWRALMFDKKRPIPIEQLAKVVLFLQNHYTERPTSRSTR